MILRTYFKDIMFRVNRKKVSLNHRKCDVRIQMDDTAELLRSPRYAFIKL